MGLIPRFNRRDIQQAIAQRKRAFEQAIINRFELVGWEFVKAARSKTAAHGGFNDVTGNLRSSIGFAVVHHGRVISENYQSSSRGTGETTGVQEAKNFMRTLVSKFEDGYALVVIAGMGYAAAVESRGKDVITGSSLEAEATLRAAINRLKSRL